MQAQEIVTSETEYGKPPRLRKAQKTFYRLSNERHDLQTMAISDEKQIDEKLMQSENEHTSRNTEKDLENYIFELMPTFP